MKGVGACELIVEITKTADSYTQGLIKDDDGTVTASTTYQMLIKEDINSKQFHPYIPIKFQNPVPNENKIHVLPMKQFDGEKTGYVFRSGKLGIGYYSDTYVELDLTTKMERVDPIVLKLQNEKGQLEPDYPHLGIQTLADLQHRCRNFGKEIIALAPAPMQDSLVTEVQALRIIKAFKY